MSKEQIPNPMKLIEKQNYKIFSDRELELGSETWSKIG